MSAVLDKIRAETRKKSKSLARARGREGEICIENTKNLQELLAPHLPKAIRSWIDGLKATKLAWQHDKWVDTGFPDWKERRECGRQIIEYVIGKPIERSMEISGSYEDLSQVLERLQSPEAKRLLSPALLESLQNVQKTESAEQPHERKESSDSEQKTG